MMFDPKALVLLARRKAQTREFVQWLCLKSGVAVIPPGPAAFLVRFAQFCRWGQTCFHPDPRIHAALEGRREAFEEILNYIQLTPDQLAMLKQARMNPEEDEE